MKHDALHTMPSVVEVFGKEDLDVSHVLADSLQPEGAFLPQAGRLARTLDVRQSDGSL